MKMKEQIQTPVSNDLFYYLNEGVLLADWWVAVTRLLVDTVGKETAVKTLRPYWEHGGKASAFNLRQMTRVTSDDVKSVTALLLAQRDPPYWRFDARGGKESAIVKIKRCSMEDWNPIDEVFCIILCEYAAGGTVETLNPMFQCNLAKSRSWGDSDCIWVIRRKDGKGAYENEEDFEPIEPAKVVDNIFNNTSLAYMGEFWILSTRAFLDLLDSEDVTKILEDLMEKKGMEFGMKWKKSLDFNGTSLQIICRLLESIQQVHQMKGEVKKDEDKMEGEISECPLSSAPPQVCLQVQSFNNGLCEAIDPNYEFAYDRMMTKGDKTCHWRIRKKGETTKERAKEEFVPEDPAKLIAMRFARGEISEEEFRKKLAVLKEFKL
jgi:hypothetical protein